MSDTEKINKIIALIKEASVLYDQLDDVDKVIYAEELLKKGYFIEFYK